MRHSDGWKLPTGEVPRFLPAAQLVSSILGQLASKAPQTRSQKTQETLTIEHCCDLTESTPLPPPVDAGLQEC